MNKRNTKKYKKQLKRKNSNNSFQLQSNLINKINNIFGDSRYNKIYQIFHLPSERENLRIISKELISHILKHKSELKLFFKMSKNSDKYKNHFIQYVLLPYYIIGNKFMDKFDEYYEFISQFDFIKSGKNTILFRCMSEKEYIKILNGDGIESPSYSINPQYITFLKVNNTLIDIENKSVFVCCIFKSEDIISELPISEEGEILVKKGVKPIFIKMYSEFSKFDLEDVFGNGILDYLPLSPFEVDNGFSYMESLRKKGFVSDHEFEMVGNQHIHKHNTKWIINYNHNLNNLIDFLKINKNQLINIPM